MKTLLTSILLISLLSLISCRDRNNIIVSGQINEEVTGKVISNAEVVVLCWYMNSIDDATFKKQTIRTDNNGNYTANFDKGHQVDVASKAAGYNPNRSYNELSNNKITVDLKLSKFYENPGLVTLLNTDDLTTPFMRVRIYANKNGTELNFNKTETFGFDFKTMTITSDTSQCDIWFEMVKKEGQPDIIRTNKSGGIIPITYKEIKSSLLYEKAIAPTYGYQSTYRLKDIEEGFFILCKDGKTYGKIILEKSAIDVSSPDGKGGYYKEFGKNISCLYQPNGSTNLTYSKRNLDLENFLVDIRMR